MRHGVIFLPGIITPAELAFGALRAELPDVEKVILLELAVYDGDVPPSDYALDTEIAAALRTANEHGFERFHLVG